MDGISAEASLLEAPIIKNLDTFIVPSIDENNEAYRKNYSTVIWNQVSYKDIKISGIGSLLSIGSKAVKAITVSDPLKGIDISIEVDFYSATSEDIKKPTKINIKIVDDLCGDASMRNLLKV